MIDLFSKYSWVKPLKDKKCKTVLNGFIEIVNESNRKPNKLQVDQGKEFCNSPMQKWLDNNYILMYSVHNKGEPVVAERFTKTLTCKIYKIWHLLIKRTCVSYLNKLVEQ